MALGNAAAQVKSQACEMSLVVCEPQGSGVQACCIAVLSVPWKKCKCNSLKRVMTEKQREITGPVCAVWSHFFKATGQYAYINTLSLTNSRWCRPAVTVFRYCCFTVKGRKSKLVPVRVRDTVEREEWVKLTKGEEEVLFTCRIVTSEAVWLLGKPDMM